MRVTLARVVQTGRRLAEAALPARLVDPAEGFDRWARVYQREAKNPLSVLDERVLVDLLDRDDLAGARVLDWGCGLGRHWPELLRRGPAELVGADLSAEMVAGVRRRFPGHEVVLLPGGLPDGVDRIVTTQVLHYVTDLDATFVGFRDRLAPGGRVILTLLHPEVGGDVSFRVGLRRYRLAVARFGVDDLRAAWTSAGFAALDEVHAVADEDLRGAFERRGGHDLFARTLGRPLVFGARLAVAP